jgi:hypothetical protein
VRVERAQHVLHHRTNACLTLNVPRVPTEQLASAKSLTMSCGSSSLAAANESTPARAAPPRRGQAQRAAGLPVLGHVEVLIALALSVEQVLVYEVQHFILSVPSA